MQFLCDFHIHSCLSPCAEITMTPGEIAKVCVSRGIDWIAITDHNSAGNVRVFSSVLQEVGVSVIPGIEVHTLEDVHVLAYFPDVSSAEGYSAFLKREKLPIVTIDPEISGYQLLVDENDSFVGMEEIWLGQPASLSISETLKTVEENGGISVMAHIDRKMGLIVQLGLVPEECKEVPMEISFERTLKRGLQTKNIMHSSDAHSLDLIKPTVAISASTRSFEEFKTAIFSSGRALSIIWD
ncbi:MAG: PHP domain protein [Mesotoga prima]|uniref:PHP domain protein n=1 Tax=Mesotoga prima TaxID=1184387 RepID=A0A101HPZ2_9BACT|nr:MAG: PHP domain protein [Mesotoga prima]